MSRQNYTADKDPLNTFFFQVMSFQYSNLISLSPFIVECNLILAANAAVLFENVIKTRMRQQVTVTVLVRSVKAALSKSACKHGTGTEQTNHKAQAHELAVF